MSEVTDPVVQQMLSEPAPELEEPAPAEDPAPAPEESAPAPVEDPAPTEDPAPAPEESAPTTQEVVQNVQEMLTTEPAVSSDSASLEERVKVLEERLEKFFNSRLYKVKYR